MLDPQRVDLLLQYALACAAHWEGPRSAEDEASPGVGLTAVSLIRYVYCADLEHARRHGVAFTGARWTFGHSGVAAREVEGRIPPALAAIGALEGEEGGGGELTYRTDDLALWDRLDPALPLQVSRAVRRAVREHGAETRALAASFVRARPFTRAAPGEALAFGLARAVEAPRAPEDDETARQRKRRREQLRAARAALTERRRTRGPGRIGQVRLFLPRYEPAVLAALEQAS
ncbi:MAG: hypothetical protein KC636_26290, partial [Myxococcales bacterium]|nr:hypothetical protein [Myxococcales bacterium]